MLLTNKNADRSDNASGNENATSTYASAEQHQTATTARKEDKKMAAKRELGSLIQIINSNRKRITNPNKETLSNGRCFTHVWRSKPREGECKAAAISMAAVSDEVQNNLLSQYQKVKQCSIDLLTTGIVGTDSDTLNKEREIIENVCGGLYLSEAMDSNFLPLVFDVDLKKDYPGGERGLSAPLAAGVSRTLVKTKITENNPGATLILDNDDYSRVGEIFSTSPTVRKKYLEECVRKLYSENDLLKFLDVINQTLESNGYPNNHRMVVCEKAPKKIITTNLCEDGRRTTLISVKGGVHVQVPTFWINKIEHSLLLDKITVAVELAEIFPKGSFDPRASSVPAWLMPGSSKGDGGDLFGYEPTCVYNQAKLEYDLPKAMRGVLYLSSDGTVKKVTGDHADLDWTRILSVQKTKVSQGSYNQSKGQGQEPEPEEEQEPEQALDSGKYAHFWDEVFDTIMCGDFKESIYEYYPNLSFEQNMAKRIIGELISREVSISERYGDYERLRNELKHIYFYAPSNIGKDKGKGKYRGQDQGTTQSFFSDGSGNQRLGFYLWLFLTRTSKGGAYEKDYAGEEFTSTNIFNFTSEDLKRYEKKGKTTRSYDSVESEEKAMATASTNAVKFLCKKLDDDDTVDVIFNSTQKQHEEYKQKQGRSDFDNNQENDADISESDDDRANKINTDKASRKRKLETPKPTAEPTAEQNTDSDSDSDSDEESTRKRRRLPEYVEDLNYDYGALFEKHFREDIIVQLKNDIIRGCNMSLAEFFVTTLNSHKFNGTDWFQFIEDTGLWEKTDTPHLLYQIISRRGEGLLGWLKVDISSSMLNENRQCSEDDDDLSDDQRVNTDLEVDDPFDLGLDLGPTRPRQERPERSKSDGGKGKVTDPSKEVETLFKRIEKTREKMRTFELVKSVVTACGVHDEVRDVNFEDKLDSNVWKIRFINGTYDVLQKKFVRRGAREDYFSTTMGVKYKRPTEAEVEAVNDFFCKIFPDGALRTYFFNYLAQSFIGGNADKSLMFWVGDGNNGKSVTEGLIRQIFGKYAKTPTTELMTKPSEGLNPQLARLRTARWVTVSEPGKEQVFDVNFIKQCTGGDSMFARELYQKGGSVKEFVCLFKLNIICNKLPSFSSLDKAIVNRLRVLDFESTFKPVEECPETEIDRCFAKTFPDEPDFNASKMAQPLAYLLVKRLEECRRRMGIEGKKINYSIAPPSKVKRSTNKYVSKVNVFKRFENENLVFKSDSASASTSASAFTTTGPSTSASTDHQRPKPRTVSCSDEEDESFGFHDEFAITFDDLYSTYLQWVGEEFGVKDRNQGQHGQQGQAKFVGGTKICITRAEVFEEFISTWGCKSKRKGKQSSLYYCCTTEQWKGVRLMNSEEKARQKAKQYGLADQGQDEDEEEEGEDAEPMASSGNGGKTAGGKQLVRLPIYRNFSYLKLKY